jgi:hypothetical protein
MKEIGSNFFYPIVDAHGGFYSAVRGAKAMHC